MEIFGIGPLELIFVLLIALIVLGPNDMVKAGRSLGRFLRKIVTSSEWRTIQRASKEFRYLPNKLIREAGLEDLKNEIIDENVIGGRRELDKLKKDVDQWKQDISTWTTPPVLSLEDSEKKPGDDQENNHKSDKESTEPN